jgi:hypothetical protein
MHNIFFKRKKTSVPPKIHQVQKNGSSKISKLKIALKKTSKIKSFKIKDR